MEPTALSRALIDACFEERTDTVDQLLASGVGIHAVDGRGWTALMMSCSGMVHDDSKGVHYVRALIGAGADLEARCHEGGTALMIACACTLPSRVDLLLRAGAAVDPQNDEGRTALMLACEFACPRIVHALLEAGGTVDVPNRKGYTALMVAAGCDVFHCQVACAESCVQALVDAGADVNRTQADGATALMLACQSGREGSVRALLAGGAEAGVDLAAVDPRAGPGWTALMYASQGGTRPHLSCVHMLLAAGATVDMRNGRGYTALMLACALRRPLSARRLLEAGADADAATAATIVEEDGRGDHPCAEVLREWQRRRRRAALGLAEERPDAFRCPILLRVMQDPVVVSDGHTYDRVAIERVLADTGLSPLTREVLRPGCVFPNRALQERIAAYDGEVEAAAERAVALHHGRDGPRDTGGGAAS